MQKIQQDNQLDETMEDVKMIQLQPKHLSILAKARETYGDKNQIIVSVEELCELACKLAKIARFKGDIPDSLKAEILDEIADVVIVFDHIVALSGVTTEAIVHRIDQKMERLERWLQNSNDFSHTTEDREVK